MMNFDSISFTTASGEDLTGYRKDDLVRKFSCSSHGDHKTQCPSCGKFVCHRPGHHKILHFDGMTDIVDLEDVRESKHEHAWFHLAGWDYLVCLR